ncbi:hypothetical protein MRX96_008296 [Rhipicephalus microplus]
MPIHTRAPWNEGRKKGGHTARPLFLDCVASRVEGEFGLRFDLPRRAPRPLRRRNAFPQANAPRLQECLSPESAGVSQWPRRPPGKYNVVVLILNKGTVAFLYKVADRKNGHVLRAYV